MNRSASEWAFERFLREASTGQGDDRRPSGSVASSGSSSVGVADKDADDEVVEVKLPPRDSEEYHAILKRQLNLACAAVALTRVMELFS